MAGSRESIDKRLKGLEITLEEEIAISRAKATLLEANIRELNAVYAALNEKLKVLRYRDERIKGFEAELFRANKLSSIGELAGSIAHEIKNPLISIQGLAKRIGKTSDREKISQYSERIDSEAERLSHVLQKLLDFSRMDEPKKERVEVREIVDDTVLFMEHHLTRFKNVGVSVEKGGIPAFVIADKIHIQQTLVNIINNAAQAMPRGGTIRIKSGVEGDYGCIAVSDEGEGISEENRDKIFEPFFTTKPKGEGTGLGLSLSKRLMETNNGRIELETKPGEGSTFKLLIPLADR